MAPPGVGRPKKRKFNSPWHAATVAADKNAKRKVASSPSGASSSAASAVGPEAAATTTSSSNNDAAKKDKDSSSSARLKLKSSQDDSASSLDVSTRSRSKSKLSKVSKVSKASPASSSVKEEAEEVVKVETGPSPPTPPPASTLPDEDVVPPPPTSPPVAVPVPPRPPNPYDSIRRAIVVNDGSRTNLVRLVGLKSLFAKQLPKMPKEYIARLVFDRRHKSLALLSSDPNRENRGNDDEILGGICYRAYPEMRFAEIAFCAVSASQQVKGYGTKLMNLLKMHAASKEGVEYFITYADNYAIGYFKKQGFTKAVQMPRGRYQGLIKDYDGGTVMECYVHPSIDFTRVPETVAAQRRFVLGRIRAGTSKSDKVAYPPLPRDFAETHVMERTVSLSASSMSSSNGPARAAAERSLAIPGVAAAGWTLPDLLSAARRTKDSDQKKHQLKSELMSLVNKVSDQQFSWCFRDPVNTEEVKDYLDVISDPIDLRTMEKRIRKGDWYKSRAMLYSDMMRMVENCKTYNGEGSTYYDYAASLEKYLGTIFPKRVTSAAAAAAASSKKDKKEKEGKAGGGS